MDEKPKKGEGAFLSRLRGELAVWRQEGIITPAQEERIRGRYDFAPADREAHAEKNRVVAIVTMAGAVLVGVGVILFFAANWKAIPRWWRFAIVLLGMGGIYGAAYELGWRRRRFPFTGRALAVAGCLLYGAGIWLIAQTFNISSHWPNGILLWALGVLPVAAALGSSPVASLYVILLTGWTMSEVYGFDRGNPWFFPLALATIFPLVYRFRLRFPLWLGIIGVTAALAVDVPWWRLSWEGHFGEQGGFLEVLAVLGAWAGVLALVGRLNETRESFASFSRIFRFPAFLILGFVLPFLTFHEVVEGLSRGGPGIIVLAFLLAAAVAVLFLFLVQFNRWRRRLPDPGALATLLEMAVAVDSTLLLTLFFGGGRLLPPWIWALIFNLHFFGLAAVLVFLADRTREWWTGYLGVILFTTLVVCRYFEYAVELLPKSLVFIAAGGLLLGGGLWLEKRRKAGPVGPMSEEVAP